MHKYKCKSCGAEFELDEVEHMCLNCDAAGNYQKISVQSDSTPPDSKKRDVSARLNYLTM